MVPLVIGFGEALIDKLPSGEVVGGAPLNFSLRAAELGGHLGCKAALVTRIGRDRHGQMILERLAGSTLDLSAIQTDLEVPTGFVDVKLDADGQPSYTIGRHVAWESIESDSAMASLATQATAICFGTLVQLGPKSHGTLLHLLESCSSAIKILDLNLRNPPPSLESVSLSLQHADVLKCNLEELQQLAEWFYLDEQSDGSKIASQLQTQFALHAVFWTRGAAGCCWQSRGEQIVAEVPRLAAEPNADSVGAGDAASAALAIGLVLDWPAPRIVNAANLCGAFAASRRGATAPLTPEVLSRLQKATL